MKAVEWAAKFNAGVSSGEWVAILEEYGRETADLITLRSKNSDFKTKLSAMAGAVNEQLTKFRAIMNKVPALAQERFTELLQTHAKDYLDLKAKAEKKPDPPKAETEKADSGRTLVKTPVAPITPAKKHPPRNRFGRTN